MTEKEKMLQGKIYDASDKELVRLRGIAHRLSAEYNNTFEDQEDKRKEILSKLLPDMGEGTYLQGPIQFDYGVFTKIGKRSYANFNLTILDCAPVTIGDNVFFGPNCTLATPMHPYLPEERAMYDNGDGVLRDKEYARPICIGNDCWIAANVVVCGGVTIGDGCVIGAGSVVTRDIPSGVIAAGNPCKVIREITEKDSIYKREELL